MKIWKKITYSKSFWEFLLEKSRLNAVARMLVKYNTMRENDDHWAYTLMVTNKDADYITMRPDGALSFLPAGKEHQTNVDGQWSRVGRQEGRPGKVIRKLFTPNGLKVIKASEFEAFGNQYKARFMDNGFEWEILPASKIPHVYDMRPADGDGTLNGSCMNGDGDTCSIYTNCKYLRILTLMNSDGRLCGRALVWRLPYKNDTITFMDRIYTTEDYMNDLFLDYAKEQGWYRKVRYTSYDQKTNWMSPDGERTVVYIRFDTDTDFNTYPYIDTFSYGGDGWLTNVEDDHCYEYDCTDGNRTGDPENEGVEDEFSGGYINEDDAVTLSDNSHRSRYQGITTHVDNCYHVVVSGSTYGRIRREWFLSDDPGVCEIGSDYYWKSHPDVICLHDGDYAMQDDTIYCETNGEYYLSSDYGDFDIVYCETDGEYYKETDYDVVNIGSLWYLRKDDNVIQLHDDEYVLVDQEDLVEVMGLWYRKKDEAIVYSGYTEQFHLATDSSIVKIGGVWYPKEGDPDRHRTGNKFVDAHLIQQLHDKWYFKNDDQLVMIEGKFYHKRKDRKILSHIAGFWRLRGTVKFALTDKQKYGAEMLQYVTTTKKRKAQTA